MSTVNEDILIFLKGHASKLVHEIDEAIESERHFTLQTFKRDVEDLEETLRDMVKLANQIDTSGSE